MQQRDNQSEIQVVERPENILKFQVNLLSLSSGRYDVLHDAEWIESLVQYQLQVYRAGHVQFSYELLQTLGETSVGETAEYREKALFILTIFLDNIIDNEEELLQDELLQAFSWIFLRWLYWEKELLSCSEYVCTLLPVIPEKLLSRGKLGQFTLWLDLCHKISSGELTRPAAVQAVVARLKSTLLSDLLSHDIDLGVSPGQPNHVEIGCLKSYFVRGRLPILIEELFHSRHKERRLAVINLLIQFGDEVVPELLELLEPDAPWYMVRNALQVVSHFDVNKHLEVIVPFLKYPDLRVQQQAIDGLGKLEGQERIEYLILALETCHDRLKSGVVEMLSELQDGQIERAFIRLVKACDTIEHWSRDHLLLVLCGALTSYPTIRVAEALKHLVARREEERRIGDPVIVAAVKTIDLITE